MKYAIDWSQFNWKHWMLVAATGVSVTADALSAKADTICSAATNVASCTSSITGVASTVGAVAALVIMIFGGSSEKLLKKKEPAS